MMISKRFYLAVLVFLTAMPALAEESSPEDLKAFAQEAYLAGEFGEAKRVLSELLADNLRNADLLRRLAAVEAALGNLDEAQAIIDRAISVAPEDGDIQLARANILVWRKQYSEAERQANVLASVSPDYPGLDQFKASLQNARDARRLHLRSLSVGASVSEAEFKSGNEQTWSAQRGSASIGWADGAVASLEVELENRRQTDTRVASTVSAPIGAHRASLSGSFTSNADFRESWSMGGGADIALGRLNRLLLDGRFAVYASGDVGTVGIGLQQIFAQNFAITARSLHLFGGGKDYRLGGVLRADYTPPGRPAIFVIAASYPDTEADGTRQLRSVAASARFRLSSHVSMNLTGEYEARKASYNRAAMAVDLVWNIGD